MWLPPVMVLPRPARMLPILLHVLTAPGCDPAHVIRSDPAEAGQLGDGRMTDRSVPVAVHGGRAFRPLSAGGTHTCAVTMTYRTLCWGTNSRGQLGDGTVSNRFQPRLVAGGQLFKQVSAGDFHTCAVTTADRAFCWGDGSREQIGDGTNQQRLQPKAVAGGLTFERLSASFRHTCGETSGSRLYCWGSNRYGQLGDGTTIFRRTPWPAGSRSSRSAPVPTIPAARPRTRWPAAGDAMIPARWAPPRSHSG
jgi:hypothetical protein